MPLESSGDIRSAARTITIRRVTDFNRTNNNNLRQPTCEQCLWNNDPFGDFQRQKVLMEEVFRREGVLELFSGETKETYAHEPLFGFCLRKPEKDSYWQPEFCIGKSAGVEELVIVTNMEVYLSLLEEYEERHEIWNCGREQHRDKVIRAYEAFDSVLGPRSSAFILNVRVRQGLYAAWMHLERKFNSPTKTTKMDLPVPQTMDVQGAIEETIKMDLPVPQTMDVQGAIEETIKMDLPVPQTMDVQGAMEETIKMDLPVPQTMDVQGAMKNMQCRVDTAPTQYVTGVTQACDYLRVVYEYLCEAVRSVVLERLTFAGEAKRPFDPGKGEVYTETSAWL